MDGSTAGAYDALPMHRFRALRQLAAAGIVACACAPRPAEVPRTDSEPEAPEAPAAPAQEPGGTDGSTTSPAPAAPAAPASGPKDARGKEEIQRVIADNRPKLRACYDAALEENPGIAGDLVVSFVIDPEGNVKTAEVNWAESEIHVPELDTCAVEAVKGLKFPASSRGLESKVDYPFNFNPAPPERPAKAPAAPSTPR